MGALMGHKSFSALILIPLLVVAAPTFAAPTVTSVVARQRTDGSHKVDITYNVYAPGVQYLKVTMTASDDGGSTYTVPCSHVSGSVGYRIRPGNGKKIVWDCGADLPGVSGSDYRVKVVAEESSDSGVVPGEMIYIPAGSFQMAAGTPSIRHLRLAATRRAAAPTAVRTWRETYGNGVRIGISRIPTAATRLTIQAAIGLCGAVVGTSATTTPAALAATTTSRATITPATAGSDLPAS